MTPSWRATCNQPRGPVVTQTPGRLGSTAQCFMAAADMGAPAWVANRAQLRAAEALWADCKARHQEALQAALDEAQERRENGRATESRSFVPLLNLFLNMVN